MPSEGVRPADEGVCAGFEVVTDIRITGWEPASAKADIAMPHPARHQGVQYVSHGAQPFQGICGNQP